MTKIWRVIATVTTRRLTGNTAVSVPLFYVDAVDAEETVSRASLILRCDERSSDGVSRSISGTVIRLAHDGEPEQDTYHSFTEGFAS